MAATADVPYEQIRDSLAGAIRTRRSDGAPGELARQLLAYDVPNHTHLVGIDRHAAKAVYYHCDDRYVIFVRFDAAGLADGGARLGSFDRGVGLDGWIEKTGAYWGWRHPRYR